MTREEAVRMIQDFFKSHGVDSPGLNENNLGGASIGGHQLYFEFYPAKEQLEVSALIYKFHVKPRPGVVDAFKAEELKKTADTGGGTLKYEPENKGLYLSRTYTEAIPLDDLSNDLDRLMKASLVFGTEVLERVADKKLATDQRG
jgi:hypothetical protein